MANVIDIDYVPVEGVHHLDASNYRKHARSQPILTCENCKKQHGKQGVDVRRCQGCWSVGFCSKECQLASWPSHKAECRTLEIVLVLEHLARNVYSNPFLLHFLRVAIILKLNPDINSLDSSRSTIPKPGECLSLFVHLRMYPLSSEHAAKLYLGSIDAASGKEKIPGFLNLSINAEPPEKVSLNGPKTPDVLTWKKARKDADAAGRQDNPIVLVNFGYDDNYITTGIELTPDVFSTARGNPAPAAIQSALPPGMELPSTIDGFRPIFSMIDKYIELDEEDKLKLRRDLRRVDKEFVRRLASTN
ncbi:hypothetical protein GALMADRAFT_258459 [Galerina marginata CBS 339.88]|uniref:MYND-type domain-containing protein n=1 Tax=Galerina marginata (strain CBS 339.88) TaxID=685588 RepID=A0A067SBG8_GALM3|nr:hypothetical protein GALMADRAFT_258459 [Galerina marginata CBS 339.88]